MSPSLRITLTASLSLAASIALAQPATGIDLSNLTPKTPSQKAAAEANANSTTGTQSSNQKSTSIGGPLLPGAGTTSAPTSNATTKDAKTTTGLLKSPFGNNAKSTPAAGDDATSSSNDVQVKIPKK